MEVGKREVGEEEKEEEGESGKEGRGGQLGKDKVARRGGAQVPDTLGLVRRHRKVIRVPKTRLDKSATAKRRAKDDEKRTK